MSSVRKRKAMLKKLNTYFTNRGMITDEREYSKDFTAPYRLVMIQKYLGGWNRMVYYLGFYYPRWKEKPEDKPAIVQPVKEPVVKKPVKVEQPEEESPLTSLKRKVTREEDE